MKKCSKCKQNKELDQFNKTGTYCKICTREKSRESYILNRDKILKKVKFFKTKYREWFVKYKSTLKCEKCNESHISCLEFHHIDPKQKDFEISYALKHHMKKEEIELELKKCIILCSNCHKKLHWEEKNKMDT